MSADVRALERGAEDVPTARENYLVHTGVGLKRAGVHVRTSCPRMRGEEVMHPTEKPELMLHVGQFLPEADRVRTKCLQSVARRGSRVHTYV